MYLYVCMFKYKLYEQVYLLMCYYFLFFFLPFFPSVALLCKFQKKDIFSDERGLRVQRWQLASKGSAAIISCSFQRCCLRLLHNPNLSQRSA